MMNVYSVGITISMVDHVSAAMGVMTRHLMQGQMAADALNKRLAQIKSGFANGAIMMGAGMAIAAPLIHATNEAAKLEQAMKRVQVATDSSMADMSGFSELLSVVSNKTGIFSKVDLAKFSATMASGGIRLPDIKTLLPMFAQSADILKVTSHASPETTAHTLTAIAHQFGKYTAAEMTPIVKAFTALAPMIPGSVKGFATMGGYVNILGSRELKMDPVQLMTLQAAAMQTTGGGGAGARGSLSGSTLINMLARTIPGVFGSGLLSGKSSFALASMGMTNAADGRSKLMTNGGLDLEKMMKVLKGVHDMAETAEGRVTLAKRMLANSPMLGKKAGEVQTFSNAVIKDGGNKVAASEFTMKLFQWAFGAAGRAAAVVSDDKFQGQMQYMKGRVTNYKGIEATQKELLKTYTMQTTRLQTNLTTLSSTIGTQALPMLTKIATRFADMANEANKFLEKHPGVTRMLVALAGVTSGMLIAGGAAMFLKSAVMAIAFFFPPLRVAIIGTTIAIGALSAIIAFGKIHSNQLRIALAFLIQTIPFARESINLVQLVIKKFPSICQGAVQAFSLLGLAITRFIGLVGAAVGAFTSSWNTSMKSTFTTGNFGQIPTFKMPGIAEANKTLREVGLTGNANRSHLFMQHPSAPKAPVKKAAAGVVNNHIAINVSNNGKKELKPQEIASAVRSVLNDDSRFAARAVTSGGGSHMSKYQTGGGYDIG